MGKQKFKRKPADNDKTDKGRRKFLTKAATVAVLGACGLGVHLILTDPPIH